MKRILPILLIIVFFIGCSSAADTLYRHPSFTAELPAPFEPVKNANITCFAPYGDPLLSSSITFYTTELNWYFDDFTEQEYRDALTALTRYETVTLNKFESVHVDGYPAKRISCNVTIDQGVHDLVIYAINADRIYFFTLLNREGDGYIGAFDNMMKTIRLESAS